MKLRPEFTTIKGEALAFIEENQWPPKSYLQELAKYETDMKAYREEIDGSSDDSKCVLM